MPIPIPVDLDLGASVGGWLASARPLPAGWQRGISFPDTACLAPVSMGECPTGTNLKPGQRTDTATFRPYSVVMAVECTTIGGYDVETAAALGLEQTVDYAIAAELLTGAASARDVNPDPGIPNPSLAGSAVDLGAAFSSVAGAVACLDQALMAATFGRGGVFLAGADMATWLLDERVIWRDGARWRTASGNLVIVSAGFDGRAPGSATPPDPTDPLYLYATAGVWAGTDVYGQFSDVDRNVNTTTSRAEKIALAAFSPCAVFAAASTAATKCDGDGA